MAELRILIILPVLFIIVTSNPRNNNVNGNRICRTRECHQIAQAFMETMNKSVDPCINFYEYACGGWKAKDPIPRWESAWSGFLIFQAVVESRIRNELERKISTGDILPVRQAKKWYHSCMDIRTRELRGLKPIDSIMMQAGGWPMVMDTEEWDDEIMWQQIDEHYSRLMGDYAFYQMRLMSPSEDNSRYPTGAIVLMSPELPLSDELPSNYRNHTSGDITRYKHLIKDVARLFIERNKANVSDHQLERDIDDVIKLERNLYLSSNYKELMKIEVKEVDLPERSNFSIFLEWWDNYTEPLKNNSQGKIDWRNVIQLLFTKSGTQMNDNMTVFPNDLKYFYMLSTVLQSTNSRTIVNYIHWNFVSQTLKYTIDEIKNKFFEIIKNEDGAQERPQRWRECVREMEMKEAMAFIFVEKYFHGTTVEAAKTMMQNIKKELGNQMSNSNWMSPAAKEAAGKKLNQMKTLLGFPEWYNNQTAVVNHYKGLTIGYDYLDNVLSFMRYKKKIEVRKLVGRGDNEEWQIDPMEVDALYYWERNIVNIPAVDFQPPLFAREVPDYVNYGTAGVIVGHEIGHGFDPQGVQYGVDGNNPLLDKDMMNMYLHRIICFIKKFDRYHNNTLTAEMEESSEQLETVNEMEEFDLKILEAFKGSNGTRTASENIADTTGIQAVLSAYKKMKEIEKPNGELKLPGFEEFTDEQMFFISLAETWCQVSTPQYQQKKIKIRDNHSPPNLRVIGSVSNTLEFGEAFNCPQGSPMNPKNKCDIWTMPSATPKVKSSVP